MVNQIFELGKRFKQRDETLHLAVEIMDRLFLSSNSSSGSEKTFGFEMNFFKVDLSSKSTDRALYEITILLIASKYDELDENIP
jgi:hypothetical protein